MNRAPIKGGDFAGLVMGRNKELTRWALFSANEQYRYLLSIRWNPELPTVNFIMLNPSTADELANDPTVERCERRARAMNYGALIVTNVFAFRSTDPAALRKVENPVGGEINDQVIAYGARLSSLVVCAWGTRGALKRRGQQVLDIIRREGIEPHCLRMTESGHPEHPLYLSYELQPKPIGKDVYAIGMAGRRLRSAAGKLEEGSRANTGS